MRTASSQQRSKTGNKRPVRVLVVQTHAGGLFATLLEVEGESVRTVSGPAPFLPSMSADRSVVTMIVVDRSMYLAHDMQVPSNLSDQMPSIVQLEFESIVPSGYGAIESSHWRCAAEQEGPSEQITAYASKKEHLESLTHKVESEGGRVACIVPSALVWEQALRELGLVLAAAPLGQGVVETAHLSSRGHAVVRRVRCIDETGLLQALREAFRIASADGPSSVAISSIGWLGDERSASALESLKIVPLAAFDGDEPKRSVEELYASFLSQFAPRLLTQLGSASWQLIPRTVLRRRRTQRLISQLAVGALLMVASALVVSAALRLSAARYERLCSRLSEEIQLVEAMGKSIESRLSQLGAVALARLTRDDLASLLSDLHLVVGEDGVSFSEVALKPGGEVELRGQSTSLALPFELPQRLEKAEGLERVLLRDAGQVDKGGASVAEFRITAHLRRSSK